MTPQEQANDIASKYTAHVAGCTGGQNYINAVNCAIIDVEGKISLLESLFYKGLDNIHITIESPVRAYRDIINPEIKYWQEVKNHLNQM